LLAQLISAQTGPAAAQSAIGEPPMTQNELLTRVRTAHTQKLDYDDIAMEVDRRGIDFELDNNFINQMRFMRAVIVGNALYRADDRRKALIAKPKNAETLPGVLLREN